MNAIMCRKRIIQICARNFETLKMIHFRAGIRALRGLLRLENGGCFMSIAALVVEILMHKVALYQQQFNTECDLQPMIAIIIRCYKQCIGSIRP